jgi:hypothetical protein
LFAGGGVWQWHGVHQHRRDLSVSKRTTKHIESMQSVSESKRTTKHTLKACNQCICTFEYDKK